MANAPITSSVLTENGKQTEIILDKLAKSKNLKIKKETGTYYAHKERTWSLSSSRRGKNQDHNSEEEIPIFLHIGKHETANTTLGQTQTVVTGANGRRNIFDRQTADGARKKDSLGAVSQKQSSGIS